MGFSSGQEGGPAEQAHVGWDGEPLGRVRPAVVQEQDVQAVGDGLGTRVNAELEALGIAVRPFQEAPLPRRGGHRAIDRQPRQEVWHGPNGLHTAGGEASAAHG
jgi:hypothetical protein